MPNTTSVFPLLFAPAVILLCFTGFVSGAPIAGCDFSTASVFDASGGTYDIANNSVEDLNAADGVSVSSWSFSNGGGFLAVDANAQISMPSDNVTKINGDAQTIPSVGSPPAALASVQFSITIPANKTVDLTSVTWAWRKATPSGNQRWLAFSTSLDTNLLFSQFGQARNAVQNEAITLSDAKYKNLTNQTVTFYWYAGGEGSGDIDFDTPVVNGDVNNIGTNPPTVINTGSTNIDPTSATIGGQVTDAAGGSSSVILYWGDNDGGTTPGNWDNAIPFGGQTGAFSTGINGLTPATTYYFRSFASNSAGTDWANSSATFSTGAASNPPTVVNNAASGITFTDADLNGMVTSTGGETPNVTIYFGDNDGGTLAGNWDGSVNVGAQSGSFSNSLFALTHNTTYFYRAFAENSGGSNWAPSTAIFATMGYGLPVVVNNAVTNITGTAAQAGGDVTSTGGDAPAVTLYWGDNDGGTVAGSWDNAIALGNQDAGFSSVLSGLSSLSIYYYRVFAQNAAGSVWADSTENFTTLEISELVINEFMAANNGGATNNPNTWYPMANQTGGSTDDWIEILNTGASVLDLGGWRLTDDAGTLNKWTFPAGTNIAAGGYLIVYASSNNAPDANGNLHTNFKLASAGDYLALVRPSGTVASEYGPGGSAYPSQSNDVSYGRHPASAASVYFSSPTPGAANSSSGIAKVGDTKFTPDRGYYQAAINVTITTATPGATIYYTTDGSAPVDSSGAPGVTATVYTAPIPVSQTTAVRASASKAGFASTNIDTQSYVLLNIDGANPDGTDAAGLNTSFLQQTKPAGWGNLTSGDYNMDTRVTKSTGVATNHTTTTAQTMLKGMRDIPTISIVMNRADFSGSNGIYTNSTSETLMHECSAEFLPAIGDTRKDWQINCGLKVQGGSSRNPGSSPKHSMNFRFRSEYGAGRLNQPLFPGSKVKEFNAIALRAGYNNSWIHSAESQRNVGSMIRDQWMRKSMLDMGHSEAGEGFMAHLFVNGLYWGVHNVCERPEASHYAAHNGGDEDLLDATNGGAVVDGTVTAMGQISSVVSGGNWSKIQGVLDIDTYIDYQIINRYGGNADLKANGNWRAAGGGPYPSGQPELMAPWQLYCWDGERTLEAETATISPLDPFNVRGTLEGNAEYRMRFADRLHKHFFNGGALTPEATKARWVKYATVLDRAIIAESARWGDHRGTLYTRDNQWLTEQNRLYNSYFPVRSANVFNRYKNTDGLYPNTVAAVFRVNATAQHGGEIPSGGILSATASPGTIYYTLDGSDPRLQGGSVNSASATAIASGATLTLPSSGRVRMRVLNGTVWSALEEATFYKEPLATPGTLAVTEIHYNPYRSNLAEKTAGFDDGDDFEFIEIRNVSGSPVNLDGVSFTGGIEFSFGLHTLPAGAYAVLVRNPAAFAVRYPSVVIAGTFSGSLDDQGESLSYGSASGATIQSFAYDNGGQWPGRADGKGSSLEIINVNGDYNAPVNWRAGSEFNGSPAAAGAGADGRIVINEVFANTALLDKDTIELFNVTASAVDVSGWYLSDSDDIYASFKLPAISIPAGSYHTFDQAVFNQYPAGVISEYAGTLAAPPSTLTAPAHGLTTGETITIAGYRGISAFNASFEVQVVDADHFSIDTPFLDNHSIKGNWAAGRPFGLGAGKGDDLWLMEADVSGRPLRFVDQIEFAGSFSGETLGRWPNGAGTGTLVSMTSRTLGAANSGAQVGPVIISEVMYFPNNLSETELEYVEICNAGSVTENLANWKLRGGADFDFTVFHSIAPGGLLVLVSFDPVIQTTAATNFRSVWGIDSSIPLAGPFTDGPLGNATGTVRLQRADSPLASELTYFPQVTEDEVIYFASAPWPVAAAGSGSSLNRVGVDTFGNFATSWTAETASPGGKRFVYDTWQDLFFGTGSPPESGAADDFDLDGIPNVVEYALGMNPLSSDAETMPGIAIEGGNVTLRFHRDLLRSGAAIRVEQSNDLSTWTNVPTVMESVFGYLELRKASVTAAPNTHLFLRVVVDY